jgi:hypothetical protein
MNRSTIALAICMMFSGFAASDAAAKGPPTGGGETSAVNNLSYPAVFPSTGVTLSGTEGLWSFAGTLGNGMSYGCAQPETIGTATYPNTSCVNTDGTYMTAEACVAGPCEGFTVEPIYWQKNALNVWQGDSLGPTIPVVGAQTATHLDWGDNLESVSWSASSIIRVETGPFATLDTDQFGFQTGFQMWHVSGQGTTELWGAHAASATQPYLYESPYAFIVTPTARLNMAKLEAGASTCPTTYTPSGFTPVWDPVTSRWVGTNFLRDIPYTAELAISGKFVYGYVWNLRKDPMPTGATSKAGWWRLTFYSPEVILDEEALLEPPTLPAAALTALAAAAAEDEGDDSEGDTGPLYRPVIDEANNLTYIDICITAAKGGGGRK